MENLENKIGYRILKVLYYLGLGISLIFLLFGIIGGIFSSEEGGEFLALGFVFGFFIFLFNEIIHLGLFYIFFGKLENYNYSFVLNFFRKNKKIKKEYNEIKESNFKNEKYKISRTKKFLIFFGILSIICSFSPDLENRFSLFLIGISLVLVCINHTELQKKNFGYKYNKYLLYFGYFLVILLGTIIFYISVYMFLNLGNKGNYGFITPLLIYIPIFIYKEIKFSIKNKNLSFLISIILTIIIPILTSLIISNIKFYEKKDNNEIIKTEKLNYEKNTKTVKELFLEELEKRSGLKNEKVDEITIFSEQKLISIDGKYIFEYIFKTTEGKDYFPNNFSEITKWGKIEEIIEENKKRGDLKEFSEMLIKTNVYLGFKYYDKNGDLIGYFEISPKELASIENIKKEDIIKNNFNFENNFEENIEKTEEIKYTWYMARDLIRYSLNLYEGILLENVNLRKEPSLNGEKIGLLEKGEIIKFSKDEIIENEGYKWIAIFSDEFGTGWAVIDYIKQMN